MGKVHFFTNSTGKWSSRTCLVCTDWLAGNAAVVAAPAKLLPARSRVWSGAFTVAVMGDGDNHRHFHTLGSDNRGHIIWHSRKSVSSRDNRNLCCNSCDDNTKRAIAKPHVSFSRRSVVFFTPIKLLAPEPPN